MRIKYMTLEEFKHLYPLGENNMAIKKVLMKKVEASRADKAMDKKIGYKEGSKKDNAMDKKLQTKKK